jgi:hypothetical protein
MLTSGSMHSHRRTLIALTLLGCAAAGCAAEADGDGTVADNGGTVADGDVTVAGSDGTVAGGDGTLACIEGNPPGDPFDVGDVAVAEPAPVSGPIGPAPQPPSAATIASECVASGGTGCDASRFISKEAAFCLAELNAFEAGLEPWSVALVYHHRHNRVVWNVRNVTDERGAEGHSGGVLTLDATNGAVLERSAYVLLP